MLKNVVRFIRKRGRIIPVRVKSTIESSTLDGNRISSISIKGRKNREISKTIFSSKRGSKTANLKVISQNVMFRDEGLTFSTKKVAQRLRDLGFNKVQGSVFNAAEVTSRAKLRNTVFTARIGGLPLGKFSSKDSIGLLKSQRNFQVSSISDLPRFSTNQKRLLTALGVGGVAGGVNAKRKK